MPASCWAGEVCVRLRNSTKLNMSKDTRDQDIAATNDYEFLEPSPEPKVLQFTASPPNASYSRSNAGRLSAAVSFSGFMNTRNSSLSIKAIHW